MNRIAWIFVLALVVGLVPAMADVTWSWTFTDNTGIVASGDLSGVLLSAGAFNITSGTINDVTIGLGSLYANPNPGVQSSTPSGDGATYDDMLYPGNNPMIAPNYGALLFYGTGNVGVSAYEMQIWSDGANSYYRYQGDPPASLPGGRNGPGDPGTFAIVATPDGGTTLSLLGLAIVGLAGLRRKLSL
jgi:hypothetical protein